MRPDLSSNTNEPPRFAWLQVQRGDLDMNSVVLLCKRMVFVCLFFTAFDTIPKEGPLPLSSSISSLQRLRKLLKNSLNTHIVSISKTKSLYPLSLKTVFYSSM